MTAGELLIGIFATYMVIEAIELLIDAIRVARQKNE